MTKSQLIARASRTKDVMDRLSAIAKEWGSDEIAQKCKEMSEFEAQRIAHLSGVEIRTEINASR